MNLADAPRKSDSRTIVADNRNTRLSGSWLIIARAVWLVLVTLTLGFYVAGIPAFYQRLQTACVDPVTCSVVGALNAKAVQALPSLGFSASAYATFFTTFSVIIALVWAGIGLIIFWRRSNDWFALVAAFFLVTFNITYPGSPIYTLTLIYPALTLPATLISFLGQISLIFFLLLFPSGRLVSRWMGLILLIAGIQIAASVLSPTAPFFENNWPEWLDSLVSVVGYGAIIVSQVYHYRRMSTPVQRQQTKWVVLAISIVFTGFIVFTLLGTGPVPEFGLSNTLYSLLPDLAYPLLFLFLPFSIGIAILRYRLYDIDILINRTLVYTALTGMLVLIYVGSIFVLQTLLRQFTGQASQPPLVTVASTLLIAALFQPLRHRIQGIIDRRFYRRKYDAARTLAAFSATLRSEVDLNQLGEHLLAVVEETMQPEHVSLWLRKTEQERKSNTRV